MNVGLVSWQYYILNDSVDISEIITCTGTVFRHAFALPLYLLLRFYFFIQVCFSDVFAEPDDTDSFDAIWTSSESVFTLSRLWCYRILSAICAIPCAFFWGISFSCLAFCTIWEATPMVKSCRIYLKPCAALWKLCLQSFCDPCYESCGKLFSNVTVSVLTKAKSSK